MHAQKIIWKSHGRNSLHWVFLFVNDNKDVNVKCPQTMRCIFCYSSPILFCNFKTQAKKHLISNGITSLKKHVNVDHSIKAKMFEEEVNSPLRGEEDQFYLVVQLSNFCCQKSFLEISYATKIVS